MSQLNSGRNMWTAYHHITDHLGSVRAITNASTGNVVETSDFLPFGTRWSLTAGSSSATLTDATNRWRYSGKEEQKAINSALPLIDYGARMYDPTIARWMSMDPMTEKYYPMSPYGYCAGNPERYLDIIGTEIEEGSQKEWRRLRQRIEKQRDKLQSDINKLNSKAEAKGWSSETMAGIIGNKAERLASLNSSIETMGILEGSTQIYSLSHTKYGENGGVTLNISTSVIDIKFGGIIPLNVVDKQQKNRS